MEDDRGIREVVEMIFLEEGYEVFCYACVKDFMLAKDIVIPDIYLLDVMLPDGDGLKVCNQLKSLPQSRHVPVLMMSAHTDLSGLAGKCKADGFIAKPFDINHITAVVEASCRSNLID